MWTICLKKKKNNPSQSKILATLEDIHMGRSGRNNKQVYMFCIDIDPVGESNKWASYLNFACSLLACSYYWIFFIELPTMLLTFWQDGLYIISLCQIYCLVFVFFDKDFLLSKNLIKKKKKKKPNKQTKSIFGIDLARLPPAFALCNQEVSHLRRFSLLD